MQYLNSFRLASDDEEVSYILSFPPKLEMSCYSGQVYPFKVFPQKGLEKLEFAPITIFYGGNGSGKSTLLNIIAEKTDVVRTSPFNNTPYFEDYLEHCQAEYTFGNKLPKESRIITSDDVFDFLLDIRTVNEGIDRRREEIFEEGNEKARCFKKTEIASNGYNLDLCKYPKIEEEILSIKDTILNYKKHSEVADENINLALAKIAEILGIEL